MKAIKTFVKNTQGRDFVVGDLHGCFSLLMDELEKVHFNRNKDRLFSVGDLTDRGKENIECLTLLEQLWFHAVKGNHEDMMLESIYSHSALHHFAETWLWYQNGGKWAEQFYNEVDGEWYKDFLEVVDRVETLPLSIEIVDEDGTPLVGLCHAQPLDNWEKHYDPSPDEIQYILWQRDVVYKEPLLDPFSCKNIKQVYCGHTPLLEGPRNVGNIRFIDTGACFKKGYLTLEEIDYGN